MSAGSRRLAGCSSPGCWSSWRGMQVLRDNQTLAFTAIAPGLALACISGPGAAASHSLAHSRAENVEVFVDHADGRPWCSATLKLRFVFSAPPPAGAVERLMAKIGSLLDGQCPRAQSIDWSSTGAGGMRVAQGSASKAGGWVPQHAAVDLSAPAQSSPLPAAAPTARRPAAAPDVIGIRIGDSEAQVRKLLEEGGAAEYKLTTDVVTVALLQAEPFTVGIRGSAEAPERSERIEIKFAAPSSAGSGLYAIRRSVNYQPGSEPTLDSIRAALEQKYGGKPALVEHGRSFWFYDDSGAMIGKPSTDSCATRAGGHRVTESSLLRPDTSQDQIQRSVRSIVLAGASPACGHFVTASYELANNPELVRGLVVSMHDARLAVRTFIEAQARVAQAHEERQRKAVEDAASRAPPKL